MKKHEILTQQYERLNERITDALIRQTMNITWPVFYALATRLVFTEPVQPDPNDDRYLLTGLQKLPMGQSAFGMELTSEDDGVPGEASLEHLLPHAALHVLQRLEDGDYTFK